KSHSSFSTSCGYCSDRVRIAPLSWRAQSVLRRALSLAALTSLRRTDSEREKPEHDHSARLQAGVLEVPLVHELGGIVG
ncbi:MAG: hypothetical protein ACI8QC_001668, partial [Planctomycetota bacterium]